MNRKLINQGAAVGSKIMGGLLFLSLLTGCGASGGPKAAAPTATTASGVILEAHQKAIEKIGGFGPCEGDCLLNEAAVESRKDLTKTNKTFTNANGTSIKFYKLREEVNGKPLLKVLMAKSVLDETKKGQGKGTRAKKDLILREGISGAYKTFVDAVLADEEGKKTETRHAKLFVLIEGLRFVRKMGQNLGNEEGAKTVKTEFEGKIAEAEAGVYAAVKEDVNAWPSIDFLKDDAEIKSVSTSKKSTKKKARKAYALTTKSKEAVKALIKEVEEAMTEYKNTHAEAAKKAGQ